MMNRRYFIPGALAVLSSTTALAQTEVLRDAFEEMTELQRRFVQVELQLMGFYTGQTDAQFGPMTRTALVMAADEISKQTNGLTTFNLESLDEVRQYLSMMAEEQFMFVYDDGYEG